MNGAWFSWRIVFRSVNDALEETSLEEFPMPGDSELDLLLAAEMSEQEPLLEVERDDTLAMAKALLSGGTAGASDVKDVRELDDVTVRETTEESLGDENEDNAGGDAALDVLPDAADSAQVTQDSAPACGDAQPDLRLLGFDANRAALKNAHIKPLLQLARRIVGTAGDRRAVRGVRVVGIFSEMEPRSRGVAESRARAVQAALMEAVNRLWPGLGRSIEFTTAARGYDHAQDRRLGARSVNATRRRAVEILLDFTQQPDAAVGAVVAEKDGHFAWQSGPAQNMETGEARASGAKLRDLSHDGYFFVLSSEAPPSRWICSLEISLESDEAQLPHSAYAGKLAATGLLISPRHILTSGHCLYTRLRESTVSEAESAGQRLEDPILRAKSVAVFPGRSGGALPFGSYMIRDPRCFRTSARWRVSRAANRDADFALLTLPRPLPIGAWGKAPYQIAPLPEDKLKGAIVYTAGYPQSETGKAVDETELAARAISENTQWSTLGSVTSVERNSFAHDLPFRKGQDGSPVWVQQGSERLLVGILSGRGHAVRLTPHTIKILRKWVIQDGSWSAT